MAGLLIPLIIELSITAQLPQWPLYFLLGLHLQASGDSTPISSYAVSNYCNHSYRICLIIVVQALYCPSREASSFLHVSPAAHLLLLL